MYDLETNNTTPQYRNIHRLRTMSVNVGRRPRSAIPRVVPTWAAFATHGPMHARVTVEQVKVGFFQDLYKLHSARSTWWTGAAFAANFQT